MAVLRGWIVLCTILFSTTASSAAEPADALYDQGKSALADERYEEAVVAFTKARDLVASGPNRWRLHIGLALAHEGRGDLAAAAAHYRAFLHDLAGADDDVDEKWADRRRSIEGDVASLDEQLARSHARLDLQSEPPGARVEVAGVNLSARTRTPLVVHLAPGRHLVTLHHPDREPVTFSVFLERGQRTLLHKQLVRPEPDPPLAPVAQPVAVAPPSVSRTPPREPVPPPDADLAPTQIAGIIGISTGGVALAAGLGLTVAASSALSELEDLQTQTITDDVRERDRELRDRVPALETASIGMYVTGGVLVVAGTFMLLLGGEEHDAVVSATPGGLGGRF